MGVGREIAQARSAVQRAGEAEARQDSGDLVSVELNTDNSLYLNRRQIQYHRLPGARVGVHKTLGHRATGVQTHQLKGAAQGNQRQLVIYPALESPRRFAGQFEATGRPADLHRLPDRRLQQHIGGCGAHLARLTAHHPGHRQGARLVTDHQRGVAQSALGTGGEGAILAVEGEQTLARAGAAHNQVARLHLLVVEGVGRLAPLQHHIVRDINNIADRAHTCVRQAALHPVWRRADGDALDQAEGEARTEIRLLNCHLHPTIC